MPACSCRCCWPTPAARGSLITAVAHGTSQLADRWGEHGMKTVWACCGTKVILGGISDAGTLEEISELCGTIVIGEDDSKTVRVVPPELIRALPDWRALVIRMNLNPVIVKFRPAWKRLGFRFGRRVPVYIPRQQAALDPGAGARPGRAGARPVRGGPGQVLRPGHAAGQPGSGRVPAAGPARTRWPSSRGSRHHEPADPPAADHPRPPLRLA